MKNKNTKEFAKPIINLENSFTSVDENGNIIKQETIDITEHQVQEQYQILSKNDFGKTPSRINIGFFNKKTNFRVSPKDSIIAFNKDNSEIESPSIQDIKDNPYRYLMIYKYPFMEDIWNKDITINFDKETYPDLVDTNIKIELSNSFGEYLGKLLQKLTRMTEKYQIDSLDILGIDFNNLQNGDSIGEDNLVLDPTKILTLSKIIQVQGINKFSLNKKILMNSNPAFLMGIIEGFFETKENKYYKIPKTINIYTFSTILNLLSASYSIRSNKETDSKEVFIIRFKLANILNEKFENNLSPELFRKQKYYFLPKVKGDNKNFKIKFLKNNFNYTYNSRDEFQEHINNGFTEIMHEVNSGNIELIPTWDLVFNKIETSNPKDSNMFDLIMENDKAHNFSLGSLPMLHNSDGDIMGVIGLFTKEACDDARKHFSAENKLKFKSPVDGSVQNWGAKNDGIMGLYNATR